MRNPNTSSTNQQGVAGLITLAAMQAAADMVKNSAVALHSPARIGFSTSPRIVSLSDEKVVPVVKGELVFA